MKPSKKNDVLIKKKSVFLKNSVTPLLLTVHKKKDVHQRIDRATREKRTTEQQATKLIDEQDEQ